MPDSLEQKIWVANDLLGNCSYSHPFSPPFWLLPVSANMKRLL
jgi:hypothetical protein